jgi:hypothetical protein
MNFDDIFSQHFGGGMGGKGHHFNFGHGGGHHEEEHHEPADETFKDSDVI